MAEQKKQNYLRGAALLAATVAVTKVVGAVYKIPLYNLLGDEGTAHFSITYTIYSLILTVSTAGIPVALSRLVSAARALGRGNQAKRYFTVGFWTFLAVGLLGMTAMFVFAEELAVFMEDYEVADGVRALAPAVLFGCLISVYRGFSQGHGNMKPTAISQIMEVVCKLVFGLAIAAYLANVGYPSATVSAGAIVGVTIGLGLAIPLLILEKKKSDRNSEYLRTSSDTPDSAVKTVKEILSVSIPIALGASVLNVITLLDSKFIMFRLQEGGAGFDYLTAKVLYGVYSKGITLFNLPNAFITPVAVAVVPFISAALAKKERGEAMAVVESSMKLTNIFAMPAAVGMFVLSYPIFNVLYWGSNEMGPQLQGMLGIASFFVCTYLITNAVLQAYGFEKLALITLPIGGAIKIAVNWVLVGDPAINIAGAPVGTVACYACITLLNVGVMLVKIKERPAWGRVILRPLICTAVMGGAAWAVYGLAEKALLPMLGMGRWPLAVCMVIAIGAAVAVYGVLIILTRTITLEDMKLVPKGEKIARLLHIR